MLTVERDRWQSVGMKAAVMLRVLQSLFDIRCVTVLGKGLPDEGLKIFPGMLREFKVVPLPTQTCGRRVR